MGQKKHKECFINDDSCRGKIKEAHILSRAATMSLICGPGKGGLSVIQLGTDPKEVGWSKASTYHCFCDIHDTEIFKPIENDNEFDVKSEEQTFLHIFRSFAYSYHKKRSYLENLRSTFEGLSNMFENSGYGRLENESRIKESEQDQLYAYNLIRDRLLATWKNKTFKENLTFRTLSIGIGYPFASAGALMAEIIDLSGSGLNLVYFDEDSPMLAQPGLMLTIFPLKEDKTIIVLAALRSDFNAVQTISKFDKLQQNPESLLRAISGLMLSTNKENTFFHPALWEFMKSNGDDKKLIEDLNIPRGTDLLTEGLWMPQTNLFDQKYSCHNIGINNQSTEEY